jgi:hypothetical protein
MLKSIMLPEKEEKYTTEKTIGYLLLFIGIAVIIFAAVSVYMVFTRITKPVDLFRFDAIKIDLSKFIIQAPTDQTITQDIVPKEVLNTPMNYFAHLLLMGFLASVGLKIAQIGTNLIRPIKIKVREEKKSILEPQ